MVPAMARVTGIGGVFFKSKSDHKQLAAWYERHLGLRLEPWGGAVLRWPEDKAEDRGVTAWHVAPRDSQWFSPGDASFMINYRVDDLEGLVAQLRRDGVPIVKGPESDDNGHFAWLLDPDGNKIELWQPIGTSPQSK
jgi:catechol 2,3-dioxygenase-like lactoylglutathione lyase family enzyme